MRKLLGYQLADANGENLQGDDDDPTGLSSFHIMTLEVAHDVIRKFGDDGNLLLMPMFEGDVEEPTILDLDDWRRIQER